MSTTTGLAAKIGAVALVQLALIGVAMAPRLSARIAGDELRFRVETVDPIEPLRGAYVALDYPDLRLDDEIEGEGTVYVVLARDGEVWKATEYSRTRPAEGTYLRCDDGDWQLRCGIESWFVPQDEAARAQEELAEGAIAVVTVDGRGHAALIRVEAD